MKEIHDSLAGILGGLPASTASMVILAAGALENGPFLEGVDLRSYYSYQTPETTVFWLLTAGRLIRVETSASAGLTTTFPIERVSRVSELYGEGTCQVTIEVDAEARGLTVSRSQFTTYTLTSNGAADLAGLVEFTRQLRLTIGI